MTQPARTAREPLELSREQRDAMTSELFAHWNAVSPGQSHCFCGGDSQLVDALQKVRAEREREREREDDELEM